MKVFRTGRLVLCLAIAVVCASQAFACSVPVFRYALERWPSSYYDVVVFHRGKLDGDNAKIVKWLRDAEESEKAPANFGLRTIDTSGELEESEKEVWDAQESKELPRMVVRYPFPTQHLGEAWSGALTPSAAKALVDSPARREVVKRLTQGETAVWVFLESGDKKADDAAMKKLTGFLKKIEEAMNPSEENVDGYDNDPDAVEAEEPPPGPWEPEKIEITFSTLKVSRDDDKERMFVNMLLHSEKDLAKLEEPMAFPIFGRGRALFALVGEGINEYNIEEACAFLSGPCSCMAKNMNPGVDMLMRADWLASVSGLDIETPELPPLTGLAGFVEETETPEVEVTEEETKPDEDSGLLARTMLMVVGGVVVVVVIGGFATWRMAASKKT